MRRQGSRDGVPSEQLDHAVRRHQQPATGPSPPGFATTDAAGSWSFEGTVRTGAYVGPFVEDITATDAEGASASGHLTAECVAP